MSPVAALRNIDQEQLTISTSEVTIATAKLTDSGIPSDPLNIVRAVLQHLAGGDVYHTTNTAVPSNSGANGEHRMEVGDVWEVKGRAEIGNWSAIIASGEADATVSVQLYGTD